MEFISNYPLSQLTTFHIGGPADYFVAVTNEAEVKQALEFAREKKLPVLVLGHGSNVLVSDEGFHGLVIHNQIKGLKLEDNGLMQIGAGEDWDEVVARAVENNLAGIECLSGIPGSAGGSLVQNIGAYGQTLGDLVIEVEAVETITGNHKTFLPKDCGFEYRNSWFKSNPGQFIVTNFKLQLRPAGRATLTYPDLLKKFGATSPSLREVRSAVLEIRASKGYLIMPGYESYNTAGSFFKNPIVSGEQFEKLRPSFGEESLNRFWPTANGVKLAAAFLLQEAGFGKGYRAGRVGISPKHSLSLINFGGAKAAEIKALAEKIKHVILEKFGVRLEEEVLYIGEFKS